MLSGDTGRCDGPGSCVVCSFCKLLPTCERDDQSSFTADVAALDDGDVNTSHSLNYTFESIFKHRAISSTLLKMSPISFSLKFRYYDTGISRRVEINLIKEIRQWNSNIHYNVFFCVYHIAVLSLLTA